MQTIREFFDHAFAVLGPFFPGLNMLDDLPADVPVGDNHLAIDGTHDPSAGLFENRHHAVEQAIHCGRPCRNALSLRGHAYSFSSIQHRSAGFTPTGASTRFR